MFPTGRFSLRDEPAVPARWRHHGWRGSVVARPPPCDNCPAHPDRITIATSPPRCAIGYGRDRCGRICLDGGPNGYVGPRKRSSPPPAAPNWSQQPRLSGMPHAVRPPPRILKVPTGEGNFISRIAWLTASAGRPFTPTALRATSSRRRRARHAAPSCHGECRGRRNGRPLRLLAPVADALRRFAPLAPLRLMLPAIRWPGEIRASQCNDGSVEVSPPFTSTPEASFCASSTRSAKVRRRPAVPDARPLTFQFPGCQPCTGGGAGVASYSVAGTLLVSRPASHHRRRRCRDGPSGR